MKFDATKFLDGLIQKESCLIERVFLQNKIEKGCALTILKINASRYFQYSKVTCGDKVGWSGNTWYSKDLLGGWIYELRRKKMDDNEIYDLIIGAREKFLEGQRGKFSYHKVYNAMINALKKSVESL